MSRSPRRRPCQRTIGACLAGALVLVAWVSPAEAKGPVASWERTTRTSRWTPPSPDPMGVVWSPTLRRLLVVDSEVEEGRRWAKASLFFATLRGQLSRTANLRPFTDEPTDVAVGPSGSVYLSDDDADVVIRLRAGKDDRIGTRDDRVTRIDTRRFGSTDPEGIAIARGSLFVLDAVDLMVHEVDPSSGSLRGRFSVVRLGMRDPEGIAYEPGRGRLLIVSRRDEEIAAVGPNGRLLDLIDISEAGLRSPSGITVGPSSDGSGTSVYVTDNGVDNAVDPRENDGRLVEFALRTPSGNAPPVVASPGTQIDREGRRARLRIVATDPDGDRLEYGASGLPPGLAIDPDTGLIDGRIDPDAAPGGPYDVTTLVDDGRTTTTRSFTWKVRAVPEAPRGAAMTLTTRGVSVDWRDGPEGVAGYRVTRQIGAGRVRSVGPTLLRRSRFVDRNVPPGRTVTYRIRAVSARGLVSPASSVRGRSGRIRLVDRGATAGSGRRWLQVTRPSGVRSGRVLVAVLSARGSVGIPTPAGWRKVRSDRAGSRLTQTVFLRVAHRSEPDTYRFPLGGRRAAAVALAVYRGVDRQDPIWSGGGDDASAPSIAAPSIAGRPAGAEIVVFGVAQDGRVRVPREVQRVVRARLGRGSSPVSLAVADRVLAGWGPTGPVVARVRVAAPNVGQAVVLRAAG